MNVSHGAKPAAGVFSNRHEMHEATQIPVSGLGQVLYFQNRQWTSSEWQGGPCSRLSFSRHLQLRLPHDLAYSTALADSRALIEP